MKSPIYCCLFLILICLGCKKDTNLALEPLLILGDNCKSCPDVRVDIPKAVKKDRISVAVNTALREEIIYLLNFNEHADATTITEAISGFSRDYSDISPLFLDEQDRWEARIKGEVSYEDALMLTIKLDSYLYTGGAHGYEATRFLNFNKRNGTELQDWELFADRKDFLRYAELKFRKQEHIPEDMPINSTGYMFERDIFYLPENIGFTAEGVKLLYNQYEVASYADGTVELVLPYKEVAKYLSGKIRS